MTPLLKPKEVADLLRIDLSSVYKIAREGKIGSHVINGGSIRFSEEQIKEYLESRLLPPKERPRRKPYTRRLQHA